MRNDAIITQNDTRNIFYKGQRENETSLSLSKIRGCHCCIDDVIASLLLNKAPKIETSVPYKGVPYKKYFVYTCIARACPPNAGPLNKMMGVSRHADIIYRRAR